MISASSVIAGEAFVKIGTDISQLEKGLKTAAKSFSAFATKLGTMFTAAGTAITTPLVMALKAYGNFGEKFWKMSKYLEIPGDTLAELAYVGEQVGAEADSIANSFRFMYRNIYKAGENKEIGKIFEVLKINLVALKKLKPEEMFLTIANALGRIEDPTTRNAYAMQLFGRSAMNLEGIFQLNQESMEALRKEYRLFFGKLDVDKTHAVSEGFSKMKLAMQGLSNVIAESIAPTFLAFSKKVISVVIALREFVKLNPQIVNSLAKIGVSLLAIGTTMLSLVAIITAFTHPWLAVLIIISGVVVTILEHLKILNLGFSDFLNEIMDNVNIFGDTLRGWLKIFLAQMAYDIYNFYDKMLFEMQDMLLKIRDNLPFPYNFFDKLFPLNKILGKWSFKKIVSFIHKNIYEKLKEPFRAIINVTEITRPDRIKGKPSLGNIIDNYKEQIEHLFDLMQNKAKIGFKNLEIPPLQTVIEERMTSRAFYAGSARFAEMTGVGKTTLEEKQLAELKNISNYARDISRNIDAIGVYE